MDFAKKIKSEAHCDLPAVSGDLFCAGVWRQPSAGVEMGDALVGLQWVFPEPERTNLSAECSVFRPGRHASQLLSAALL